MSDPQAETSPNCFPATQWTEVIEVIQKGDDHAAQSALNAFCLSYRPAIYNFFRRHGSTHEQAQDDTQSFFESRILERWDGRDGFLHTVQRSEQRRFRSFLSTRLWWFLRDRWKAERTQKAGRAAPHIPLTDVEQSGESADAEAFKKFGLALDREIALEIFRKAAGHSTRSNCLLAHFRAEISQADAAIRLGMKENAFKQAFARFRTSFPHNLRKEVSNLVGPDAKEIEEEIKHLMSLFAQPPA